MFRVTALAVLATGLVACKRDKPPLAIPSEIMVQVPAGPMLFGCHDGDDCVISYSRPGNPFIDEFWIDQLEVTVRNYGVCIALGACSEPDFPTETAESNPATVRWAQARDYCAWRGKRLPSEAEWEKAARGDDGRPYPWGLKQPTPEDAYFGNGIAPQRYSPVGQHPRDRSPSGALDMLGNAPEWVADPPPRRDAAIEDNNDPELRHIEKTGAQKCFSAALGCPLYVRSIRQARPLGENRYINTAVGFRCALTPTPAAQRPSR